MATAGFGFANGNLAKLLALPKYLLSVLLSWCIPRQQHRWVFGSGIGVAEGALALARELHRDDPAADIVWLTANEAESDAARSYGFRAVACVGWAGFWETLRAGQLVVTHGLGDVNRFGGHGGFTLQLWHGAPLKRLHLDSSVTTTVRGPALVRSLLKRMYLAGSKRVDLFVAGSETSAERLRTAFRVAPGKVRVLGDPRDDVIAEQLASPTELAAVRTRLCDLLDLPASEEEDGTGSLVLYAPTWRDGEPDPAIPSEAELGAIQASLTGSNAHLVIRPHTLGIGAYEHVVGDRVHLLSAETVRDITPLLSGFDAVITDYSSTAIDFSLTGNPIVWFAPDLEHYSATRGLYEPLEVTSGGAVQRTWSDAMQRLDLVLRQGSTEQRAARAETRKLRDRFQAFPAGGAARRVLAEARRLRLPDDELVPKVDVFFESFYGRQIGCNPLALDREIAAEYPELRRFWSVTSERQSVPAGATAVLVGGRDWLVARKRARLVVVNDWLRYGFRRGRSQTVLQTWHGTMLKHLALGRPGVGLRTRLAIRRESRRWSLLLSQNQHASEQFRESYAYRGEVLESGYPRNDRLARAVVGNEKNPVDVSSAKVALGVARDKYVLTYAPTWRDSGISLVDELGVEQLAEDLGDEWVIVARGHTRTHAFGRYASSQARIVDASRHDDVNDVILAADVLVTDYSSIMFDASVARTPQLFFVPDLARYRDRERGFTFDFEKEAPGPLLTTREEVAAHARALAQDGLEAEWIQQSADRAQEWRLRFNSHDDGGAARRVVRELVDRGALPRADAS